jgi:hypothetical protein
MNAQQFWNIENVSEFNGYTVSGGEVSLTDDEYAEILNDIYGTVEVCGQTFDQGTLLKDADAVAFRCGKGEEENRIQAELEEQLEREDSSGIEFIDGDEFELDEEEEE